MPSSSAKSRPKRGIPAEQEFVRTLLELFSDCDAVFRESDAFSSPNKSLGRIYRSWKIAAAALDPDFDDKRYKRGRYEDRAGRSLQD